MPSGQLETPSDHFEYLSFVSVQMERDMHDGIFRTGGESCKEAEILSCIWDFAEFMLDLCSYSSSCIADNPITALYRESFNLKRFAEHASCVAYCHKITNSELKRYLVRTECESDLINGDRAVLYRKTPIGLLCMQLHFANRNEDAYFRPAQCLELDENVHYRMESELFLDIHNERNIELMSSKQKCGV